MYLLRKEEMQLENGGAGGVKEILLYHVTTKSRAMKSLKSGLDWRLTRRSRYGCGVSFSQDAEYADKYADSSTRQGIIICQLTYRRFTVSTEYPGYHAEMLQGSHLNRLLSNIVRMCTVYRIWSGFRDC